MDDIMKTATIGFMIIFIIIIGAVTYQTIAQNNLEAVKETIYPTPEDVAFNYTSPNVTYYRLYPRYDVYIETEQYPNNGFSSDCIDERKLNKDTDYIYVIEESIMQWNWYSLNTASLPLSPTESIDEIIVTIEGMFTNQATTKICTALAPNGVKYDEIPLELISNNQSVIYPFYQRIQYKWENNPTKTDVYKSWDWEDVKEDFQVGIGAYYNNYDNENGELRISQVYVDVGV
jgi:hypothetical protein